MSAKPNIILIITDQQRADTIGALGAPWMHTPALDRLAREGAAFSNCFVTSPVCVGSRASLFTGMYPHATGVFTNFHPWEPNWVRWLAESGYHCASIGKMHINPYDALGGFHQRFVVENKDRPLFLDEHDRAFYDEWDKALHARKLIKPSRYTRHAADPEGYRNALGAFVWAEFERRWIRFARPVGRSWRVDETYIRVRGQWRYLYRAVDKRGQTVDFRLSKHRDIEAAKAFFRKALVTSGAPMRVTLDGHWPSHRAIFELRREARVWRRVKVRTGRYLNNIVEQDHRTVKARAGPMLGFKTFVNAARTIAGIELIHRIRKGQFRLIRKLGPMPRLPVRVAWNISLA